MAETELTQVIKDALEDLKAVDITLIDVSQHTSIADTMVIASGTSARHVKSLADNVITKMKEHGHRILGTEGVDSAEWVLVDAGDAIVHIMLPGTREFYDLERLWGEPGAHFKSRTD